MKSQIEIAKAIAYMAHRGQTRRDGITPYFNHVEAVAKMVSLYNEYIVAAAYLHDVLEDTSLTVHDLSAMGIANSVIGAVVTLTKTKDEKYEDYIKRVADHHWTKIVKIADIQHNLSDNPSNRKREIYIHTLDFLQGTR